jgi:hypothetical protein
LLGLIFKKGFAGLTAACVTLAVTTAAADPPDHAGGPHGSPPGQEKRAEPGQAPAPAADAPAASEPAPEPAEPPARERVQIRSVEGTAPAAAPVEDPAPRHQASERPKPRDRVERAERPAPSAEPAREPAASPPPATASEVQEAVPAPPTAPERDVRAEDARSEPAKPEQLLPVRVVPREVRDIVEVVPGALWVVLGALAVLALAFGGWSWVAALRARRLGRQREALLQEVGLLQTALLPAVPPGLPVSVAYRPAEGGAAGGDFYDAFELSGGRTGVIVGDVSGHGRDALARTTFIRYTLRAYLEAGLVPREVIKVGADALEMHLDDGFATVTVAVYDPHTGRFTYASAGHPPPVVTGCDSHYEPVTACSAPPLGIGEGTGVRQTTFTVTAGSRVCLYTDGVTDARVDGRLLGAGRLERALASLPADADAAALLDAIAATADEITDDMAICLVDATADAPAAGPRIEELEVDEHEVGDALERFLRACGVPLAEVPGILREAGEAARREGSATVRVRENDFRPGVDVVPGNLVRLSERRRATRIG